MIFGILHLQDKILYTTLLTLYWIHTVIFLIHNKHMVLFASVNNFFDSRAKSICLWILTNQIIPCINDSLCENWVPVICFILRYHLLGAEAPCILSIRICKCVSYFLNVNFSNSQTYLLSSIFIFPSFISLRNAVLGVEGSFMSAYYILVRK